MLHKTKNNIGLYNVMVIVILMQAPLYYLLLRKVNSNTDAFTHVAETKLLAGIPNPETETKSQVVSKPNDNEHDEKPTHDSSKPEDIYFLNSQERKLPSSEWAPLVINSECKPGMPSFWAPCVAEKREQIEVAEELIYPDFSIAYPQFTGMKDAKDVFHSKQLDQFERAHVKDGRSYRQGLRGQNYVIRNGRYANGRPGAKWSSKACMSLENDFKDLLIPDWNTTKAKTEYAILVNSPDSWSFQHFLDRVTRIIEQPAHLLPQDKGGVKIVIGDRAPSADSVKKMYKKYGYNPAQVVSRGDVVADRFIYSCRTVMYHPYMALRVHERIVGHLPKVPLSEKKVVLFFSREGASHGRGLTNEKALIEGIQKFLEERNKSEVLKVMKKPENEDFTKFTEFLYTNVTALIGGHGGAIFNHRFCGLDSLIIEIMPSKGIYSGNWEEAMTLGQNYWMPIFPSPASKKTEVNIPQIIDILKSQLGKPAANSPVLKHYDKYTNFKTFG